MARTAHVSIGDHAHQPVVLTDRQETGVDLLHDPRRVPVTHVMGHAKVNPATLTPAAQPQPDGTLVYPAEEELENATPPSP